MNLETYLRKSNKTVADFSREISLSHEIVRQWIKGFRKPKPANVEKIVKATGGKVTRATLRPDIYATRKRAA